MQGYSYGGQIQTVSNIHANSCNDKVVRVKPGEFAYGLGCKRHPNCFNCPFPDCQWSSNESYATGKRKV